MGTHKLFENIFFFEKRITDNLEVFYRYLVIFATFENVSIVMFCLFLKIITFQAKFINFVLCRLHEALDCKQRKVRDNSLIDQMYVVNQMFEMDLLMRKRVVFGCIKLVLDFFIGVGLKFGNNVKELVSILDYLRIIYLFLVVVVVKVANFDDNFEKNCIKVKQIVIFFEVETIKG